MEIFLDQSGARAILEASRALPDSGAKRLELSLDLNLGRAEVEVRGDVFIHEGLRFPLGDLERPARSERKAFRCVAGDDPGPWEPLEVFTDRYHQLVPTAGSPTIEVDGIQMHRTSGVDPFEGASETARSVVRPGSRALDTCGGLGYTAIGCARLGVREVVSTEPSDGVRHLRRLNPWSRLELGLPIVLHEQDAALLVSRLPGGSFDAIVHDPPRFSLAPDLYADSFYAQLRRVLAPGGRLFHYTGSPWSRGRGRDFLRGVSERLRGAGFRPEPRADLQGFLCVPAAARRPAGPGPRGPRRP